MPERKPIPFWSNCKYDTRCSDCGDEISVSERVVLSKPDNNSRWSVFCADCGREYAGSDKNPYDPDKIINSALPELANKNPGAKRRLKN